MPKTVKHLEQNHKWCLAPYRPLTEDGAQCLHGTGKQRITQRLAWLSDALTLQQRQGLMTEP